MPALTSRQRSTLAEEAMHAQAEQDNALPSRRPFAATHRRAEAGTAAACIALCLTYCSTMLCSAWPACGARCVCLQVPDLGHGLLLGPGACDCRCLIWGAPPSTWSLAATRARAGVGGNRRRLSRRQASA